MPTDNQVETALWWTRGLTLLISAGVMTYVAAATFFQEGFEAYSETFNNMTSDGNCDYMENCVGPDFTGLAPGDLCYQAAKDSRSSSSWHYARTGLATFWDSEHQSRAKDTNGPAGFILSYLFGTFSSLLILNFIIADPKKALSIAKDLVSTKIDVELPCRIYWLLLLTALLPSPAYLPFIVKFTSWPERYAVDHACLETCGWMLNNFCESSTQPQSNYWTAHENFPSFVKDFTHNVATLFSLYIVALAIQRVISTKLNGIEKRREQREPLLGSPTIETHLSGILSSNSSTTYGSINSIEKQEPKDHFRSYPELPTSGLG